MVQFEKKVRELEKMRKYKFTIITVCFNADMYITNTIVSLRQQRFTDYEYIIKDGGSTDRTMDYVYALTEGMNNVNIISGKDKGIYDAMNIAINIAKGDYIYFLNAGDCFINEFVLDKIFDCIKKSDFKVIYGNIVLCSELECHTRKYGKICSSKLYYLSGDCICHQAIFAQKKLFETKQFDISYKVCADKEWQLYWLSRGINFTPIKFEIAEVMIDGFSKRHVDDFEEETIRCLKTYEKSMHWVYKLILKIKKSKLFLSIFRYIEKKCFCKN